MTDIIVIGGGAAGMMAALTAAQGGASVALLERNPKLGRKLYITGKGRCNVTNHCSVQEVLDSTPRNSRFLYGAMTRTPPAWVEDFFQREGVPLKVERGNRVFPESDRAADIIDALFHALRRSRVRVIQDRARHILVEDGAVCGVAGEQGEHLCKAVILATGGASYPATGSTGDGYAMAAELGHTVMDVKPSLVPLETEGDLCPRMQGLALKNVVLKVKNRKNKVQFQEQGELLFTHFGLSGPLVPRLMIPVVLELSGIPPERKAHDVTKGERRRLLETLKGLTIPIKGPRPIAEAIVTSGGIKVGEIDPKTMASKKIPGLFLAGELIDVDAYTGGFNLQIAWATGRAAGEGALLFLKEK